MGDDAVRRAAKWLVVDERRRVLLFEASIPELRDGTFWFCPGGGLEGDETWHDAARRELLEETGIDVDDPGPALFDRLVPLAWEGRESLQHERYFLVRVASPAVSTEGWTDEERRVIRRARWWTVEELRATSENIFPDGLADVVDGLDAKERP